MIDRLLTSYPIEQPRTPIDEGFREELGNLLHRDLHELYETIGLGKLGGGLFELMDPRLYREAYAAFFGGDAGGRTPFMINAFGEPIAFKRLGVREAEISILHTYGPQIEVLAYDLNDFFDRILLTDDGLRQVVNVPLFNTLRGNLRALKPGECYGFDPNLLAEEPAGTKADASYFEVVDVREQMELLLELAG